MPIDPTEKVKGMLGLCARAGGVQSGVEGCCSAVRKGRAFLTLIDVGASDQTKKSLTDACRNKNVEYRYLPDGLISSAIGKSGRMAAAIVQDGFAKEILKLADQQRDCGGACRE